MVEVIRIAPSLDRERMIDWIVNEITEIFGAHLAETGGDMSSIERKRQPCRDLVERYFPGEISRDRAGTFVTWVVEKVIPTLPR